MANKSLDLEKLIKKLQDFFLTKGFEEKEFKKQLKELGIVVMMAVFKKLLQEKPPTKKFASEEEIISYLKKNFSSEEIKEAIENESKKIGEEYLKSILGKI